MKLNPPMGQTAILYLSKSTGKIQKLLEL